MPRFKVAHRYTSSLGALEEGAEVEYTDDEADAFNRDSPGVLVPVRAKTAPPADRQGKGAPVTREG